MNKVVNGKTLPQLQRRPWELLIVLFAILTILSVYIVLGTVKTDPEDWIERSYYLKVYIIGFSLLMILFIGYIIQRELTIQKITRKLLEEEKRD